jgi:hypothetical protein
VGAAPPVVYGEPGAGCSAPEAASIVNTKKFPGCVSSTFEFESGALPSVTTSTLPAGSMTSGEMVMPIGVW